MESRIELESIYSRYECEASPSMLTGRKIIFFGDF